MAETGVSGELMALLELQLGICDEMISLSQREQQALTRLTPTKLPEILAAQSACTERLGRAQGALDAAVRTGAESLGPVGDGVPASNLEIVLEHFSHEARGRYAELRDGLAERAYTLAVLNAQNALLVRSGLLQIDRAAAMLSDVLGETLSYGAEGAVRVPASGGKMALDRQA